MESMTKRVEMKDLVQVFRLEAGDAVFLTSTQTNVKPSITIFELPGVQEKVVGHLNLGQNRGQNPPLHKITTITLKCLTTLAIQKAWVFIHTLISVNQVFQYDKTHIARFVKFTVKNAQGQPI